jgi:CsoR family transcriptional regulator, copper-sensing transcriptional repressor
MELDGRRAGAPAVPGYRADKAAVLRRLRRVEGQVRGLERMVEEDRYCIEVLDQVAAVTRALQAVALTLVDDHLSHCVVDAVAAGGPGATSKLDEASAAIARLVRS